MLASFNPTWTTSDQLINHPFPFPTGQADRDDWNLLGDHNLTPYNHSKNRPAWCDVECHKRYEYVFLITNWFWGEMTQFTVRQIVLEPRSWVRVMRVSLWERDYWRDHNLTPYNHSKNRLAWCDVECHKRFKYVFLITNWFWGGMTQLTVRKNQSSQP